MYTRQPLNPKSWRNELSRATMTWDPVNYPSHHSLRTTTTCISLTWLSHGYGLYTACRFMLILLCSLCMLCLLLCLCHAIVTLSCIYPWFTIMLLLCVFACLVEILVAIAMFIMCLMLLIIVVLARDHMWIAMGHHGSPNTTINNSMGHMINMAIATRISTKHANTHRSSIMVNHM